MGSMTTLASIGASIRRRLARVEPPLAWTLRGYRRSMLRGDAIGGVTVAALIVPLSIGYAQVAGLPPVAGLYASLVPLLAYAIFGSARRLIVGPDAATAALVGATIVPIALAPDDNLRLASGLALLVALVFVGMRAASLGFLADFLSRPILVGYMTGVGISVALDQIPKILGGTPLAEVASVLGGIDLTGVDPGAAVGAIGIALEHGAVNGPSIVIGGLVLVGILVGERVLPGVPIALPALVAALVATMALDLAQRGVEVLGPVPSGLPPVALPLISIDEAVALLPGAVGIAILSFADTALTGRSFSARHGEDTDPDRELVALAAADLGGSLTSGYPVSSSPSRTAAAEAAGATTQLAGIIAAGVVALVLLFLAGLLTNLPIPALGAIVLTSAIRFIDIRGVRRIWRMDRIEGAIAFAATAGVILYGTLFGVGIAALLAALNVFRRAAQPRVDELGRLPDEPEVFADLGRGSGAVRVPGVLIVRFAGPLFFATATPFKARIRTLLVERPDVRRVVVDAAPIVDLDLTAADALGALQRDLAARDVELILARPTGALRDLLRTYGLADLAGREGAVTRTLVEVVTTPADASDLAATDPATARDGPALDLPGAGPVAPSRGRSQRLAVIVIAAVAVGALATAVVLDQDGDPAPGATVSSPDLIGLTLAAARDVTDDLGLVLDDPVVVPAPALPESTVIRQVPAPGTPVVTGSIITPTVTTREAIVLVPDVVGQGASDAIVTLTVSGLRVAGTTAIPDATVPAGVVVAVDPPAGQAVAVGTEVRLVVSSGPPDAAPTPMPTEGTPGTPAPTGRPSTAPPPTPDDSDPPSFPPSGDPGPAASAEDDASPATAVPSP